MSNDFYTPSGAPSTNASLASSTIRAEFALLSAGFDKIVGTLSGQGLKAIRVNAGGSALEAVAVTGTGSAVFSNSPSLVTPVLGAASATSISVSGQITSTQATGTAPLVIASTTVVPNLYVARAQLADTATTATTATSATNAATVTTNANLTGGVTSVGNAATVVTNANLTGVITSVGNATSIGSQTGTGTTFVMSNSPTLVTPTLGVATGTSLALGGGTALSTTNQTGTGSLVLAASPTLTGTITAAAINASGIVATKAANEQVETLAPANNASQAIDWSFGGSKVTHTGTNALTFSNVPATGVAGKFLDLDNLNNFSFPGAVDWGLGGIPSIAGRVIVNLTTDDGGTKVFAAIGWRAV